MKQYLIFPYGFYTDSRINKTFKHFNLFFYIFSKMAYNDYKKNGLNIKKGSYPVSYNSLLIDLNNNYKNINYKLNEVKNIINYFSKKNVFIIEKVKLENDIKKINSYSLSKELEEIFLSIKERKNKKFKKKSTVAKKEIVEKEVKEIENAPEDWSDNFEEDIEEIKKIYKGNVNHFFINTNENNLIIKNLLKVVSKDQIVEMLYLTKGILKIEDKRPDWDPTGKIIDGFYKNNNNYRENDFKRKWISPKYIFSVNNIENTDIIKEKVIFQYWKITKLDLFTNKEKSDDTFLTKKYKKE